MHSHHMIAAPPTRRMRTLRTALVALILVLGSLAAYPPTAGAVPPAGDCVVPESGWGLDCSDPTLTINGKVVHLTVGVPREQVDLVEWVTLEVVVPANARAQLTGVNAAHGVGRLQIQTRLLHTGAPSSGSGPLPVTATATVQLRSGTTSGVAIGLVAWQPSVGHVGQVTGTTGTAMTLAFNVR